MLIMTAIALALMAASDEILEIINTIIQVARHNKDNGQQSPNIIPKVTATPLPPLKLKNMGNN